MDTKIPPSVLKPRFIKEVPRTKYMPGPKLRSNDEANRRSFISLLRKGPTKKPGSDPSQLPVSITLNCALWITVNKPLSSRVSLVLHCKETSDEYCMVIDETTSVDAETVMLSGTVCLHPNSPIEFIKLCSSGLTNDYHIFIDELHIDSRLKMPREEKHKRVTWAP